jgi:hypothetical protein
MVTEAQFSAVEEYAHLTTQIKALEEARKALKSEVQKIVSEHPDGKFECNDVVFSIASRKKWSYPSEIVAMESDVKEARKNAETDGTATFEVTQYLVCR